MILDDQVVLNHPFADCVSLARSLKVKNDRNNTLISKTIPFSWMNSTYVAVCRQLLQGCILSIKIPRAKQQEEIHFAKIDLLLLFFML